VVNNILLRTVGCYNTSVRQLTSSSTSRRGGFFSPPRYRIGIREYFPPLHQLRSLTFSTLYIPSPFSRGRGVLSFPTQPLTTVSQLLQRLDQRACCSSYFLNLNCLEFYYAAHDIDYVPASAGWLINRASWKRTPAEVRDVGITETAAKPREVTVEESFRRFGERGRIRLFASVGLRARC